MEIINVHAHPRNHNLGDFIISIVNKQWCILPHEIYHSVQETKVQYFPKQWNHNSVFIVPTYRKKQLLPKINRIKGGGVLSKENKSCQSEWPYQPHISSH